ncbi:MAG: hypothetical protein GX649_17660 [Chloroflexi bacterium]|nr:hypothetical protein [Chloroflexota bacterium]
MIKHSFSFWQLMVLIATVALIVPLPASRIGGGRTSALSIAAYHGESYIEAAQRWAHRAERDLQRTLYPPTRSIEHAWASLADEWGSSGEQAMARLGAIGLKGADLRSVLPLELLDDATRG